MGAAGLTSSSVEMAGKGDLGIELNLDLVPMREEAMSAYEIMLSESQERMLMVLKPDREAMARKIFDKYELDCVTIGTLTTTGRLVLKRNGKVEADMPVQPISEQAPQYDRPHTATPKKPLIDAASVKAVDPGTALTRLMGSPDLASRRWIWEQYDHLVRGHTVQRPGGDAAVVRLPDSQKGLALVVDCTPRYCAADPEMGGMQAVVETWRNITAVGGLPIAITDNMNFGNPERPEIMGQFVGCIAGMRRACEALDYPVVSGNVSLYNETNGQAILPAPVIGGVGLIADVDRTASIGFKAAGEDIIVIGATMGHLGASLYLREIAAREDGAPPAIDLATEKQNGDLVRRLITEGKVTACHDLSDGGLLVGLAEMALAGNLGVTFDLPDLMVPLHAFLFGEDQARYVVTTNDGAGLLRTIRGEGIAAMQVGTTGGTALTGLPGAPISLASLRQAHENWLPDYMSAADAA
jgi:phosphoribosylformylglycinamidine synthase II